MKTQSSVIAHDDDDITDVAAADNDHPPGVDDISAIDGGLSGVELSKSKVSNLTMTHFCRVYSRNIEKGSERNE